MIDVAAEDRGVQRDGVGQVVRDQQELPAAQPRVVLGDHVGQALLAPGVRVAAQDRVQDRHEVALAGPERPVQVAGPRTRRLHRGLDHPERPVEFRGQLLGDHVLVDGGLLADPLGQGQHEVPGQHPVRDLDQVTQQRGHDAPSP